MQEIWKIVETCEDCAGESPGPMHAHMYLHFKYLGKAQQACKKRPKKSEKLQKSASWDPKVVTGNYASRKVS
jgi:hypothetical protein